MAASDLEAAVARGIDCLHRRQLPEGDFLVLTSDDLALVHDATPESSPFGAALIAYALSFSDAPLAHAIRERAARFLVGDMAPPGMWRYWSRGHAGRSVIPVDVDDTVCCATVLRQLGVPVPPNDAVILANRDRRGLFYTWVTLRWPPARTVAHWRVALHEWPSLLKLYRYWRDTEAKPYDIDGIVNANVLFYLGDRPETRPIVAYLLEIVRLRQETACDRWYQNPFMFYYATGRNFDAGITALKPMRDTAMQRIVDAADTTGRIGMSDLDTALAICALLSWRCAPPALDRAAQHLVERQAATGAWERAAIYYGGPKRSRAWGSEEITTGFCIEALTRYRTRHTTAPHAMLR